MIVTATAQPIDVAAAAKGGNGKAGKSVDKSGKGSAGKTAGKAVHSLTVSRARSDFEEAGVVPTREVRKLANRLAQLPIAGRAAVAGIGPRRAEIIVPGALVFAELLESFALAGFRYSPLGLRDGILAQMLAVEDARAAAHREFEHVFVVHHLNLHMLIHLDHDQVSYLFSFFLFLFHKIILFYLALIL